MCTPNFQLFLEVFFEVHFLAFYAKTILLKIILQCIDFHNNEEFVFLILIAKELQTTYNKERLHIISLANESILPLIIN